MNIANLTTLRDFLLNLDEDKFDMNSAGRLEDAERGDCSSPACIGGWARAIFKCDGPLWYVGLKALGMSGPTMESLFYPVSRFRVEKADPYNATPTQAANVLTHLIATGEVDWSKMDAPA